MATASPLNLVSETAKAGWSAKLGITPNLFSPGMSFAVRTISIPSILFCHFFKSPNLNFALWYGDLIILINKESLGQKSAPKISVPNTFFKPSILGILLPPAFL